MWSISITYHVRCIHLLLSLNSCSMAGCIVHWRCVRTQVILQNRDIVLVKTDVSFVHGTNIFVGDITRVLKDRRARAE